MLLKLFTNSGDQDSVVPLIGSRATVQQLARQMQLNTTVPYRVWFAGQQVIYMDKFKLIHPLTVQFKIH